MQLLTFESFPIASHFEKSRLYDDVAEGFPHLYRNDSTQKNFAAHSNTTCNMGMKVYNSKLLWTRWASNEVGNGICVQGKHKASYKACNALTVSDVPTSRVAVPKIRIVFVNADRRVLKNKDCQKSTDDSYFQFALWRFEKGIPQWCSLMHFILCTETFTF